MKLSVTDIAVLGLLLGLMEAGKRMLDLLPNVEVITLLFILYALYLGKKAYLIAVAFTLLETSVFGLHTWVVMYLYMWPLLITIVLLYQSRKKAQFSSETHTKRDPDTISCQGPDAVLNQYPDGISGQCPADSASRHVSAKGSTDPCSIKNTSDQDIILASHGFFCVLAAAFGLLFGALCTVPYFFIGGPSMAFTWWVAGIPYDLIHCVSNFLICLFLFRPLCHLFGRIRAAGYL